MTQAPRPRIAVLAALVATAFVGACGNILLTDSVTVHGPISVFTLDTEYWIGSQGGGVVNLRTDGATASTLAYFAGSQCVVAFVADPMRHHYVAVIPSTTSSPGIVYPLPHASSAADFERRLANDHGISLPASWETMLVLPLDFMLRRGGWN